MKRVPPGRPRTGHISNNGNRKLFPNFLENAASCALFLLHAGRKPNAQLKHPSWRTPFKRGKHMDCIIESFKDNVLTITLNRPEKKNALNSDMFHALCQAFKRAEADRPGFIVLRGSGKAFCSGGDLADFKAAPNKKETINAEAALFNGSIAMIRRSDAIVIAVLEGAVIGAGVSLAAACDLAIAEKKTVMNLGYRRIGLTPDGGGSLFLPRLLGAKRFGELYLLSRNIPMEKALELGLVNVVVEEDGLEAGLQKLIDELKSLPMETVSYCKKLVNLSLYPDLDAHLDREREYMAELADTKEFRDRLDKFLKK
jgi:2-(1,2-epoxy-1,2-dihydrophenyl)acetyl-CoA isomerase